MKLRLLAVLCALLMLLSGCGYWVVEDAPVSVGRSNVFVTEAPSGR